MAAPAKVITNGTGPVLNGWRFRKSVTSLDDVEFTAQNCSAIDTYKPGDAVPGYSSMRIVDTTPVLVAGSQFDIQCRARGLLTGVTARIIARQLGTDTAGWDTLRETRVENKQASQPQFGTSHPQHANLYFMSSTEDDSMDDGNGGSLWVQRTRFYRGLAGGVYKRISRKITTNESVTNHESVIVNLPGGWSTAHPANVSFPRIVVEDTVLTTVAPPTGSVPGNYSPPSPPSVTVLAVSDNIATWNWPNGWKLNSINSEELFLGAGVFLQTIVYEYVPLKTA